MGAAPLLVRIAGLPAERVECFSTSLGERVEALERATAALREAAASLADRIHAMVPAAAPAGRRFLLAVRRDCHNGRSLARHRSAAAWADLRTASGGLAERVERREDEAVAAAEAFHVAYAAERERQDRLLRASLDDAGFRRALALASPELARSGMRTGKAGANLLRYLSRAAVKLSPFSAFTRVGLAAADAEGGGLVVAPAEEERSLVRVRPYLLDRSAAPLLRHPPVRRRLRVVPNGSCVETGPGRFLFLRPAFWAMAEGRFSYHPESLVRVGLGGAVVETVRAILPETGLAHGALVERLAAAAGIAAEAAGREVEALIGIGWLVVPTPWQTQAGYAEREMLAWLRALPPGTGTEAVRAALERLVALEAGFAASAEPVAAVDALEDAIERLWDASARLGGTDPAAVHGRAAARSVYEDVLSAGPAGDDGWRAAARLPRAEAEDALRAVQPLVRLTSLFDHRRDWLHALDAFARTCWPAGGDVPLLEVFQAAQPLWREHLRFRLAARAGEGWRGTWNPFGLAAVEALAGHRDALSADLPTLAERGGNEQRIDPVALARRLDGVPPELAAGGGASLFLQPLEGDGPRWVLNRVKEGTGRFGSRFTPVMDPRTRRRYTRWLAERGRTAVEGEEALLLDLRCVQGDTLNVHALQTPRVLTLPGAEREAPAGARVPLDALVVRFGAGLPHLRDRAGRRLLPVQLGFAFDDYLPPLVKLLARFGPSEMGAIFPPQWTEERDGILRGRRSVAGPLVVHRATWIFPTAPLLAGLAGRVGADAFAALDRWRREHGVPSRVFVQERVRHPRQGFRVQPQYLDLTSPLFADLFRGALAAAAGGRIALVEALPSPDAFPTDADGKRRAVEVVVDSLALAPASVRPGVPRARRRVPGPRALSAPIP